MSYYVVGGTYKNTLFKEFAEGREQEKYGPFNSYRCQETLGENLLGKC